MGIFILYPSASIFITTILNFLSGNWYISLWFELVTRALSWSLFGFFLFNFIFQFFPLNLFSLPICVDICTMKGGGLGCHREKASPRLHAWSYSAWPESLGPSHNSVLGQTTVFVFNDPQAYIVCWLGNVMRQVAENLLPLNSTLKSWKTGDMVEPFLSSGRNALTYSALHLGDGWLCWILMW